MEVQGLRTCAGCKWNRKKVAKRCTITTESHCFVGQNYSHRKGYCSEYEPRFESKNQVKKQIEVELL